jgi:hypothetical protein
LIHAEIAKPGPALRGVAVPLACVLAAFAMTAALSAPGLLPRYYFFHQDIFVLGGLLALLVAGSVLRGGASAPMRRTAVPTIPKVAVAAAICAILLWAGTHLLFGDYALSRDEQMVLFDMAVFRHGQLAAPLAAEWRGYADALTPAFLLPLPGNAAWVSSYLPVNAMLRSLFGSLADPALMNPLLAAAGAVATFDCARRLFPRHPGAQAIALLMYATSAQVLVTAMTPFAMTGHLALNMIWLSLFLRGKRAAHAAAIATGFLAMGLHQVIFHPLFALPLIDHLRRRGEWRTALAYLGSYALFGLFWLSYPHLVAASTGLVSQSGPTAALGGFFVERVFPLLTARDPHTIPLMAANLLRFFAWENLALVPLILLGLGAVRRGEGLARALAAGIILTTGAMTVLIPYQAIGWGYRYLHGLIGGCALLAAYGWRDYSDRSEVRAFVVAGTLATLVGAIPFLVWQAESVTKPYARVDRMIDGIDADMAVVETEGPVFRIDEVRNRPDLSNRPIRLASHLLSTADIAILCARGRVAFVDAGRMSELRIGLSEVRGSAHLRALRAAAPERCRAAGF